MLLRNTIQGGVVLFSALYSGVLCTQSWHSQIAHIYVRGLTDLSWWGGLLYSKFRFCEQCAHEKQHVGVTFGNSTLLRSSKQVKNGDSSV